MLTRLSFNQKISDITQNINSNHNEKQNNQKNLNRAKRTSRLSNLDSCLMVKPVDTKQYQTNADTKLNLSLSYATYHLNGDYKPKISSRNMPKHKIQITHFMQKTKSNTQQYCQLYGKDILAEIQRCPVSKNDFLKNHEVSPLLRTRMLDWMVQVMKSYKFGNKTYFSGVEVMDRYFAQTKNSVPITQLHITGVVCMFIATKMDQIQPLKIKTIYEKIVHKKISKQALVDMQMRIFAALDHKVNSWTFFDLALLKVHDIYQNENSSIRDKMQEIIAFVSKFIVFDYNIYTRYDMETLAKVVVRIGAKILKLSTTINGQSVGNCTHEVFKSYKGFKQTFKGLNNIFRFTDQKTILIVDNYFLEEDRTI